MITWEGMLFVFSYGLYDGGPLGSIVEFLFTWVGYTLVVLCLAEMNSMFPAGMMRWKRSNPVCTLTRAQAGGQYHCKPEPTKPLLTMEH